MNKTLIQRACALLLALLIGLGQADPVDQGTPPASAPHSQPTQQSK